ncbi:MAG: transcriptional regulator, partial [Proteobacteria bacterium]|nr:transcriptional regulator [Pseudomonadota bacterium]
MQSVEAEVGRLFNALGDPTRRAILDRLTLGPASVSHLAR